MYKSHVMRSMLTVTFSAVLLSGSVYAQFAVVDKAGEMLNNAGNKVDSSVKKLGSSVQQVDGYLDDGAVTAKVKAALLQQDDLTSQDISVETVEGKVTLSGFVPHHDQSVLAVTVAKNVSGVQSVVDALHVRAMKPASISAYASDSAITTEVKAKLLLEKTVEASHINVKTTEGEVLLTGTVDSQEQLLHAAKVAASVKGVKIVQNDLVIKAPE